jgi:nicotinamidase-related amidase
MADMKSLILIDFINDIVDKKGKLAGKGYPEFIENNGTREKVIALIEKARAEAWIICHVRVGFDSGYINHPETSPLFGAAKKYGALNQEEWGCEFIDFSKPKQGEVTLWKRRVSAFFNTELDSVLRVNNVKSVYICGCATDLAVQAAARDAHDRDFDVTVVSDACAAATDEDHATSLSVLSKIAKVVLLEQV